MRSGRSHERGREWCRRDGWHAIMIGWGRHIRGQRSLHDTPHYLLLLQQMLRERDVSLWHDRAITVGQARCAVHHRRRLLLLHPFISAAVTRGATSAGGLQVRGELGRTGCRCGGSILGAGCCSSGGVGCGGRRWWR